MLLIFYYIDYNAETSLLWKKEKLCKSHCRRTFERRTAFYSEHESKLWKSLRDGIDNVHKGEEDEDTRRFKAV